MVNMSFTVEELRYMDMAVVQSHALSESGERTRRRILEKISAKERKIKKAY